MANQEKTRVKQQYFIPLEVKEGNHHHERI